MKQLLLAMTAVMFLSTAAMAADAPATTAAPVKAAKVDKFPERKKAKLDKIAARLAELQKKQECVNAAADAAAMKACFPARTHHKCDAE